MTKQEFIEAIAKSVIKYAPQFNIKCYSAVIGQACCESSYGTSPKGQRNNFFGLKYREGRVTCHNGTFIDGSKEQRSDGHYDDIVDSWYTFETLDKGVLGYFQFINTTNYASLKGVTDPKQYLINIKAAGYASSLDYVNTVMNYVIENDLTRYDEVPPTKATFKVAVDAGHGSNTAGKRSVDGYREHWINVSCASFCDQALTRCGIEVLRVAWDDTNAKDDEDVALSTRQKLIKANHCNVAVSFHANAHGNGSQWTDAQGVETLISDKAPGDSRALANIVQSYLIQGTPQKNRGVKTQSLAMCNCNALGVKAAILVEIGFMTNKVESDLMKTDSFCREQAEEVAHGICDYLGVKYIQPSDAPKPDVKPETPNTYLVRINTDVLNVRGGAGTSYPVVTQVRRGEVYTIVDEKSGWGKLKSGAGWIKLSYTVKI